MTVGTGKDIEDGIYVSVSDFRPDRVIFFATEESIKKKKEAIEEKIPQIPKDWILLPDEESFDELADFMCQKINEVKQKYPESEFAVDATFGTKAMTSALIVSAYYNDIDKLSYVSGSKRDDMGRVIPGTEKIVKGRMNLLKIRNVLKEAVHLFNESMYVPAKHLIERHESLIKGEIELSNKLRVLKMFTEMQIYREAFSFQKAGDLLKEISEKYPSEGASFLGIKENFFQNYAQNSSKTFMEIENDPVHPKRLGELILSAKRSAKIGRFDDAVARLYRAVEFIGQVTLSKRNLYNHRENKFSLDDSIADLIPPDLKEAIQNRKPIGLRGIYTYLYYLGYKQAVNVYEPEKNSYNEILNLRNKSILAHGFRPLNREDFEKIYEFVIRLARDFSIDTKPVLNDLELRLPF
jgi:CRISPR-associated protein (TIGR02710 family)